MLKLETFANRVIFWYLARCPILNDSQEVVRVEYVPADADIYVRHQIAYYQEVPLSYEKKVQSGTSKTSWYFRVGDFVFGADTGKKSRYITSTEEIPWKLTENFVLPFPWEKSPEHLIRYRHSLHERTGSEESSAAAENI